MKDWYSLILKLPWIKGYVKELYRRYQIIKPADEKAIEISVKRVLKGNFFLSIGIIFIFCSFWGATPYVYGILLMAAFVVNQQWVKQRLLKEEKKLLQQLEKYLGDVRHYYHTGGLVEEAVYESMETAEYEIRLHMYQIYDILVIGDKEAELRYRELAPNKFLTTFLALCQITMEYGDSLLEGKSQFIRNLNYLREEIRIELLKREKTEYVFSGLVWICILPVFFLKIIENWGIKNLTELEGYYHGIYGIVVSFIIFLGTWLSYQLISNLRNHETVYRNHSLLQRLSEMPWLQEKIKIWIFKYPKQVGELKVLLERCEANLRVPEFLVQSLLYAGGGALVTGSMVFHIGLLKGCAWFLAAFWGILGGIFIGAIMGLLPKLLLAVRFFFGKREKEDEVLQFHSIILMLMYLKRMNVETILIWMENFSRSFRSAIEECVDNYSYDNEAALRLLKEREPFLPFVRLIEDLEACDRVGVLKAFDEVAGQRSYFLEKRKQDNEIIISEKGALARLVAYIPMVLTLLLYLIVPFVLESINQLGGYMSQVGM